MKKIICAMLLGALPLSAFADYGCTVKVSTVLVYADGSVNIVQSARGDYTYVCNMQGTRGGVDTATCATWVALLASARKENANVMFYYSGSGSCATLPIYGNSPTPVYIGTTN